MAVVGLRGGLRDKVGDGGTACHVINLYPMTSRGGQPIIELFDAVCCLVPGAW